MSLRALTPDLAHSYREAGIWQDLDLASLVASRSETERPAITDVDGTLSYTALVDRVSALADRLEGIGCRPGDVVALQSRGRSDILTAHLACAAADLILMPLSTVFTPEEIDHLLGQSGAKVLILTDPDDTHGAPTIADLRRQHRALLAVGTRLPNPEADFDLASTYAAGSQRRLAPTSPDRPHLAMISSGTTQLPKVSVWTDNNLWFLLSQFWERADLGTDDVLLQIAPANTGSTGYVFPVLAPVLFGAHSVMLHRWSAAAALDAISAHRVTAATAVPTQMIKMVAEQLSTPRDVSTLRVFNNAGAKLEEPHARRVESVLGCRIQTSYGASDGGVPVLTSVSDDEDARLRSVGRPLPLVDLVVVNERLQPVTPGSPGEVLWRTPSKSFGYLADAAQDAEAFHGDGWYRSGDLGVIDDRGYLTIVGRSRDMIIRGGQNINPGEIEETCLLHPAIEEIAVVGVLDPVYGERAAACVVLAPGHSLDLDGLCDFLRSRGLPKHKLPESLETLTDLPRNSGGKVSKLELRDLLTKEQS